MESIEDAQSFSGKTPITLSGGFSVETLTGVTLSWKTEYPESCSTAIRCVARKVAAMEGGLVLFRGDSTMEMYFQTSGLAYDKLKHLGFPSLKFIGLPNIYWLSSFSISHSSASLVVMSSFYRFVSLSY